MNPRERRLKIVLLYCFAGLAVVIVVWLSMEWWVDPKTAGERIDMATAVFGAFGASLLLLGAWNTYGTVRNSRWIRHERRSLQIALRRL